MYVSKYADSHSLFHRAVYQPDDQGPVAPSAIAISTQQDLPDGTKDGFPVPRELKTEEMPQIAQQFADGARNALAAGFDGVEVSRMLMQRNLGYIQFMISDEVCLFGLQPCAQQLC